MSKTHVIMVVDMSGSMSKLAADVRGGFNEYINRLKKDKIDASVSVTLFDQRYIPLCTNSALDQVPKLDENNYMPSGSTALLDATGTAIQNFETSVKAADDERILVVVYTDGYENASREFRREQINALIEEREATGKWVFIYLGAAREQWRAEEYARAGGAPVGSTVASPPTGRGVAASFSTLSGTTAGYSMGEYRSKDDMLKDIESGIRKSGNGGETKQESSTTSSSSPTKTETPENPWPKKGDGN